MYFSIYLKEISQFLSIGIEKRISPIVSTVDPTHQEKPCNTLFKVEAKYNQDNSLNQEALLFNILTLLPVKYGFFW